MSVDFVRNVDLLVSVAGFHIYTCEHDHEALLPNLILIHAE